MLSAGAYSFHRQARLAISLSWIGGYLNVIAFLICHTTVSHMTGNTSQFGHLAAEALKGHATPEVVYVGYLILTFFAGAAASGLMTEGARRQGIASKYMLPLAVEGMLIAGFAIAVHLQGADVGFATGIAAFAMGLQNATITKISGAVVRSTHVTGVITDLGLEGAQYFFWLVDKFRRRSWSRVGRVLKISMKHPSALRLLMLFSIFGSFLVGATAGTLAFEAWGVIALLAPIAFLAFIIFEDWRKPIADIREIDVTHDPELNVYGILHTVLPPELGIYRFSHHRKGSAHRAPDFQNWIERLPTNRRVVILALSPLVSFDRNSILDLEAAVEKLHQHRRELMLAGVTPAQYRVLNEQGWVEKIGPENVFPDLEFAVAAGMEWVRKNK